DDGPRRGRGPVVAGIEVSGAGGGGNGPAPGSHSAPSRFWGHRRSRNADAGAVKDRRRGRWKVRRRARTLNWHGIAVAPETRRLSRKGLRRWLPTLRNAVAIFLETATATGTTAASADGAPTAKDSRSTRF